MNEHSERQFVSHIFQAPGKHRLTHYPPTHYPPSNRPYVPMSDDEILDFVVKRITAKKVLSQSTDDITERVSSPVIPCDSTVDGEGHEEEGGSREDNENTPMFQNDGTDYHPKSRPETHSSESGKEGTGSIKPVAEEVDDLYCETEMIVLPHEVALKMSGLHKGQSDTHTTSDPQYEDVTDEESPQMDTNPLNRGESLLEPSCKCLFVETDDGDFECQPCPACVRRRESPQIKDTTYIPSVYGVNCNPAAVSTVGFLPESPSMNAKANDCYEWEDEEEEDDDDGWDVIGPMEVSSVRYIPPDVGSKSALASSPLEVFENMECFKEAKAKQLGIPPERIHGFEVDQSNSGTAAPIAPARSRPLSFSAAPPRSPQHSAENGSHYPLPQSPVSMESSSNDSDFCERKGDQRKVKRRKLSKSKNMVSKSKAESDRDTPADCQKRGLISPEIEGGPRTPQRSPQSNSSETENSSDCSMSPPPQRNRLTVSKQFWEERSNSPLLRSISNYEIGEHDDEYAAPSPLRRSVSHEPCLDSQKVQKTILKTPKNDSEKKQAKNGDDKDDSVGCRSESGASRLFKSREASFSKRCSSESTVNSDRAKKKPSNSRQSSALTKANVFKPREGLPVSKQGPAALGASGKSSSAISGREEARNKVNATWNVCIPLNQTRGNMTGIEANEDKSSTRTMPGPPHCGPTFRQRRNSPEPAPRQKRNSLKSAARPRRNSLERAPRQRHNSHESAHPLRKKTMDEARNETKRKSTHIHPTGQSGKKPDFTNFKWSEKKNLPRGYDPSRLRDSPTELDMSD